MISLRAKSLVVSRLTIALLILIIMAGAGARNLGNGEPAISSLPNGWRLSNPSSDHQIEGYASTVSVPLGGTEGFHISCTAQTFSAQVYRMGYYDGLGAGLMKTLNNLPCHRYAIPAPNSATGLINCQWPTAFNVTALGSWRPGIYLVKLTASSGYQSYVPFTIRSAAPRSRFLFIHAVNTDNAYNQWGGDSLYGNSIKSYRSSRAIKVSFNRPLYEFMPFATQTINVDGSGNFLSWEYPMIKFLEKNNYSLDYATDVDIDLHPDLLRQYQTIIITGHDEYWSMNMRNAYLDAIKHKVNLAIFAANTGYRPIRYESDAVSGAPDRIIVDYKSSHDPIKKAYGDVIPTPVNWRQEILNSPESEITGLLWGSETSEKGTVSADLVVHDSRSWIFKNSGLKNGDRVKGLVGYEYDTYSPKEPRPAPISLVFQTQLTNSAAKKQYADSGLYTYPGGGQVFNAGTIQWSWGLDPANPLYSPKLTVVTKNILDRFGLAPTTSY